MIDGDIKNWTHMGGEKGVMNYDPYMSALIGT